MRSSLSFALVLGLGAMLACARIAGLDRGAGAEDGTDAGAITTDEGAVITPASFTITAACNAQGTSDNPLKIRNAKAERLSYRVEVDDTQVLSLSRADGATGTALDGEIEPAGSSPEIRIVSAPGVAGSSKKSITVTVAGIAHVLPLEIGVSGGVVQLSASLIDFGPVKNGQVTDQTVTVTNDGNDALNVTGWGAVPPSVTIEPSTLSVPAHQSRPAKLTFRATGTDTMSATLRPTTAQSLCSDAPDLQLRGSSVDALVTVNPGAVDFGNVACNSGQKTAMLTVKSYAPTPLDVTIGPAQDPFVSFAPATVTVGTNAQANVNVLLDSKRAAGSYETTASAVNSGTDPAQPLTFRTRLVGAHLDVSATQLAFGPGQNRNRTLTVSAVGNQTITFNVVTASPKNEFNAYFNNVVTGQQTKIGYLTPGFPGFGSATLHVDANTDRPDDATVTFTTRDAPFCLDAPVIQLRKQ